MIVLIVTWRLETCGKINALITDCDIAEIIIIGDFNCSVGSRCFTIFLYFLFLFYFLILFILYFFSLSLSLLYFSSSYCVLCLCSLMAFDCQEIKGLLTYLLTY